MYILDTDHLIVLQRRSEPEWSSLRQRMQQEDRSDFCLTIVSVHEQILGANKYISRAKSRADVVRGYRMIELAMIDYRQFNVLPFDDPAATQFEELRSQGVRIGTMDLRIASIAHSRACTVLTRNAVDFEKVPALQVEDWTR